MMLFTSAIFACEEYCFESIVHTLEGCTYTLKAMQKQSVGLAAALSMKVTYGDHYFH